MLPGYISAEKNYMAEVINIEGKELYRCEPIQLNDKEPVYVIVPGLESDLQPGWGITDITRKITIHTDLTIRINNRCKYYVMAKKKVKDEGNIIYFG